MEPYGFAAIAALDRLPFMKTGVWAAGQSSYDRLGGNKDHDNYLAIDGELVLLDVVGPGTVYRFWCGTGIDPKATITFHVDGRRYDVGLTALFAGDAPGFPAPFVGTAHGGSYCYVPLPFQRSMRITLRGGDGLTLVFYNIGLHHYAPGTSIVGWTPDATPEPAPELEAARRIWNSDGAPPLPPGEDEIAVGVAALPAGGLLDLLDIPGPRALTALRLLLRSVSPAVLNDVWLRITWDDGSVPGVYAPVSAFFAVGRFERAPQPGLPKRAIVVGIDANDWLYAYFPMPFQQRALVTLESRLAFELPSVQWSITHRPFLEDFAQVGYFTTAYARQIGRDGRSLTLLDVEGSGHLVGVTMSIEGPDASTQDAMFCFRSNALCFLEGDERIYIDDSRTPAFLGTGTEDFFNSGWYFKDGPFHAPVHGCTTIHEGPTFGVMSAYRLLLHDAVPFRKHLRAVIEHGPQNDVPVLAWTLAYYYFQPATRSVLYDVLDLGDPASREAHDYAAPPEAWQGFVTSTFEGDANQPLTHYGYGHKGTSVFTMRVPPDNDGVVLRRLFDQHITNQHAMVAIDGEDVGVWYRAGGHVLGEATTYKWREDDFVVPARLTRGKRRIEVRIRYLPAQHASTDWDWNEFRYTLYALHDDGRTGASLKSPRVPTGTQVGAVSRSIDQLDILVADEHGALIPAAWNPSQQTWLVWGAVRHLRVEPGAPVHMVRRSDNKLDAFITDVNRRVVSAAWEPGLPEWRSFPLPTQLMDGRGPLPPIAPRSAVTAVSRLPDHLDIFVVAENERLYSTAWPSENGGWRDWFGLAEIAGSPGLPAHAVSRSGGKLDVFIAGRDGDVYSAAFSPDAGWSTSNINRRLEPSAVIPQLAPDTVVTAVSRSQDHLDIFLIGADGFVYTAAWEQAFRHWRGWHGLALRGKAGHPVHVVSPSPDRIDLFVADKEGRLHTASWPIDGKWQSWELSPAPYAPQLAAGAPIAAVSRSPLKLDIFTIEPAGPSGRVLTAAWEPQFNSPRPWRGWTPIGY